ncbi:MAG: acylphosphatase [Gemmatimonadaceae bacterium]
MSQGGLHLMVRGRVQGVGFRWFVREEARRLGLAGRVSNRPDGAVELAASGPATALADLRLTVAGGPPSARVDELVELPLADVGEMPFPFSVRR